MKQEDWTQRLRDRLADYEEPVPEDLWAKIEARLPQKIEARKKARIIPLWAKWAAVAAVFVGAVMVLWNVTLDPRSLATEGTQEGGMRNEDRKLAEKRPTDSKTVQIASNEAISSGEREEMSIPSEETVTAATVSPTATLASNEAVSSEGREESPISSEERTEKSSEPSRAVEAEKSPEEVIRELDRKIAEYKGHRSRQTAVSLYASNGFGNLTSRNGVLMSQQMLANYDYSAYPAATRAGDSPVYLANHEERQKHYQPVSFGLTAKIPISSRFSLSSGVVYTRLRTDLTSIVNNNLVYERQQTLQYVGVPLTLQYSVWQWRGLNVYAAVGGQADFNVKACQTDGGVETELGKDKTQWSVNAAVGVQYDIIPMLGVYAEPGIKYYFDNGSSLRNFFKYQPTNFNLQVGLRLNIR